VIGKSVKDNIVIYEFPEKDAGIEYQAIRNGEGDPA
jgi:hypothetical protein